MTENEIAIRARQVADKIENLWNVIKSPADSEQRADRIRSDTTEILCDVSTAYSWLEMRDATAADRLMRRLCHFCDRANASVNLPKGDHRVAELCPMALKTAESVRSLADLIEADQPDAVAKGDDTKDDTPKKKRWMNAPATDCARIYRKAMSSGENITMKAVVEQYVTENEGSADSIMRTLNDNPDQWKKTT